MAITREKKEELVALYKEMIEQTDAMIFTDYRGISVPDIQSLRASLRESGAVYMVVKNRLFRLALEQSSSTAEPNGLLEGRTPLSSPVRTLQRVLRRLKIGSRRRTLLKSRAQF